MLLHRRTEGREWATFEDSFKLLHHLLTPGNYRTGLRWTDVSSRPGIIGSGTKVGVPYLGTDQLLKVFAQFMQVGKVGNTLFSASKLLLGGGKSSNEPSRIHNLIPGHMLQWLDYREIGIPEMETKTTDEVKRAFYEACTKVVEGEINPLLYLKDTYDGPSPSPNTKKSVRKEVHDYSDLPDFMIS